MSIEFLSIRQVKAARALLGWSQNDLVEASGVSYATIARLETGDGPLRGRGQTVASIRAAFRNIDPVKEIARYDIRRILSQEPVVVGLTIVAQRETPQGILYEIDSGKKN